MALYEDLNIGRLHLGNKPLSSKVVAMGAGTADFPLTTDLPDKNHVEFRFENTATSGDNRGIYLRFYLNGAGGGGEALRAFTTVEKACGTAHGAHLSLNYGDSGSLSGLGVAARATLHLPSGTATGTLAPVQSEFWLEADDSAPPAAHGLFRGVVDGDTTNKASVKNLLMLAGVQVTDGDSGVADMVTTGCEDAVSDARIKISVNGTPMWLLVDTTVPVGDGA